jgi:lycopene beta-cyclase
MTYFSYLLGFVIAPLIVLTVILIWKRDKGKINAEFLGGRAVMAGSGLIALMALVYTTPWDNYLVASGVWGYRRDLISGLVLGWVPIEEYLFFILETFLTGAWWWFLVQRTRAGVSLPAPAASLAMRIRSVGSLAIVWLLAVLILVSGWPQGRYLGLILAWALPVLALQLAFGADILWRHRRLVALTVLPIAAYLSVTDSLAIVSGTWSINPQLSTGILILRLPLEEALFFLVTALIVTFGLTLFTAIASTQRLGSFIPNITRKLNLSR